MSDFRDDFPPPSEAKITRELRDILDSAVRDEPPLFLDPAQIVAAGEIRSWRRRLGASVVLTALAAVLAVVVTVPLAVRHGARSHGVDATAKATHQAVPAAPSTSPPPYPRTTANPKWLSPLPADPATADRLTEVLVRLLPLRSEYRPAPPGTSPLRFVVTDGIYNANADVVDQFGYGHVAVTISAGHRALLGCGEREPDCYNAIGPNEATLTVRQTVQPGGGHDWMVTADRADNLEVTIQASDYTWAAGVKGSAPSQRDTMPMTLNQMIKLATDPALTP